MTKRKRAGGAAAQAYHESRPASKVGEFAHANAQIADLKAKTTTAARTGLKQRGGGGLDHILGRAKARETKGYVQ